MDEINKVESNETSDIQNVNATEAQPLPQNTNIPAPTYAPIQNQNISVSVDVQSLTGWATFRAVIEIIYGASACLSIVGAIFGVPLILAAIKLLNYVDAVKVAFRTNNNEKMKESVELLQKYFKLNGIAMIIAIAFAILVIIVEIILIFLMIAAAGSSSSGMDFFGYDFSNSPDLRF